MTTTATTMRAAPIAALLLAASAAPAFAQGGQDLCRPYTETGLYQDCRLSQASDGQQECVCREFYGSTGSLLMDDASEAGTQADTLYDQ
ncbi:hypothetical protein ACTZWW_19995 [Salinarimonas sp. NSM]|uniref:hypothetical protein n=1 Tax=Salinarimonas sp. NSM TaxID=3458003 RepID=UPI00403518EA